MLETRQQLSLYLPAGAALAVEQVREIVDPLQRRLIPAHVTLCREDELQDLAKIKAKLGALPGKALTLSFGQPESFSSHGWLLNCLMGASDFQALREYILGAKNIRQQSPHITLAHPRNPKAAGNHKDAIAKLPDVLTITFPTIHLIEQAPNAPWQIQETYRFSA